ncbi:hypothetical protein JW710_03535 [Candidatus Dojkabacteria bacterium]|nr:hypothetical protein [Candidatus Dojkabacteria bacterium]
MKPKSKTRPFLIAAIVLIVILGGIGIYIAYTIYRTEQVTPEESEAATCCSCKWVDPSQKNDPYSYNIAHARGVIENDGKCHFVSGIPESAPGDVEKANPSTCVDVKAKSRDDLCDAYERDKDKLCCMYEDDEGNCVKHPCCGSSNKKLCYGCFDKWSAVTATIPCEPGCIASSSNPPFNPSDLTGEVTFTGEFELKYALPGNSKYTQAELHFVYPSGMTAPDPITVEVQESMVTNSYNENGNSNKPIKIYTIPFETTWDQVVDPTQRGTYRVRLRALDEAGEWTSYVELCTFEYVINEIIESDDYCTNLDIAPTNGTGEVTSTLEVDADLREGADIVLHWMLDLNCDGEIDESIEGEEAESFTVTGTADTIDTSISRTFRYPEGEDGNVTCSASVRVEADGVFLSEISEGACSGNVTLSQASPDCGNGTCEEGETCDPEGNVSCVGEIPEGQTCRDDCTYCGDGTLDSQEECDPGITDPEDPGYNADCSEDCEFGEGPEQPTGETEFTVVKDGPDCVELVSPNNVASFTLTVTNNSDTSEQIRAVSDALPLGFTYNNGSSSINGAANPNDDGVVLETVDNSQLITWNNLGEGWTIAGNGGTLVITFSATAGPNTIIGTQTNRVTVTPSDGDPIPAEYEFMAAQVCEQPETGIFSRNVVIILAGSGLLVLAATAYYTGIGTKQTSEVLVKLSGLRDDLMLGITQPQKLAEKKMERSALKKISRRINGKKKGKKKH